MARPDELVLELLGARHLLVVAARDLEHQERVARLPRLHHSLDLLAREPGIERVERADKRLPVLFLGERVHELRLRLDALDLDDLLLHALRPLDEVVIDAELRQVAQPRPLPEDQDRHRGEGLQALHRGDRHAEVRELLAKALVVGERHVLHQLVGRRVGHRPRGLLHRLDVGDVGLDREDLGVGERVLHGARQRIPLALAGVDGAVEVRAVGHRGHFPEEVAGLGAGLGDGERCQPGTGRADERAYEMSKGKSHGVL